MDDLRAEEVAFAFVAPLVVAADLEGGGGVDAIREGVAMAGEGLLGDRGDVGAFDAGGRAGEVLVDDLLLEADALEDLGAEVALDGRDADLGGDLDDALGGGLHVVLAGGVVVDADQQALFDHVVEGLERQVGVDARATVADERAEVVHFARFAGLEDEADLGALAFADQVVVQAGDGEQGRDGGVVTVDAAVAQDDEVDARVDVEAGLAADFVHGQLEALGAGLGVEEGRDGDGLELSVGDVTELGEFLVGEDRRLEFDQVAAAGVRVEQVALRSDRGDGGGDDLFADTVDRRVGDLREELLEVVVEELRLVGHHRERDVGAHRAHGFDAVLGHRDEQLALVFEGVAEGELALDGVAVGRGGLGGAVGDVGELDEVLVEPRAVRLLGGDLLLDLLVGDDATFFHVHEEHAARLQAALGGDVGGVDREDAGFGAHDDEVILGHVVAGRAEAVAVQGGADHRAVGEDDGGGAVPRLHEAGVVFVERLLLGAHGFVAVPRLRNHHHHGLGQGAAAHDDQLEDVVELGGVGTVRVHDREDLREFLAEQRAGQQGLAGLHPVDVAVEGVDLAVVRDVVIRVRAFPAREGVGREARVDEREGGVHRLVGEVGEVLAYLFGHEHALVDDGPAGEGAGVVELVLAGAADLVVGLLAQDEELAFEVLVGGAVSRAAEESLADDGLAGDGGLAEGGVVDGDGAPAEDREAEGLGEVGEGGLGRGADLGVRGDVEHAHAVVTRLGEVSRAVLGEEPVGELEQDARAVTGVGLTAAGASVVEVHQDGEGLLDDIVRTLALHLANEADAAGVMLKLGVVKTLFFGKSGILHFWCGQKWSDGLAAEPPGALAVTARRLNLVGNNPPLSKATCGLVRGGRSRVFVPTSRPAKRSGAFGYFC